MYVVSEMSWVMQWGDIPCSKKAVPAELTMQEAGHTCRTCIYKLAPRPFLHPWQVFRSTRICFQCVSSIPAQAQLYDLLAGYRSLRLENCCIALFQSYPQVTHLF